MAETNSDQWTVVIWTPGRFPKGSPTSDSKVGDLRGPFGHLRAPGAIPPGPRGSRAISPNTRGVRRNLSRPRGNPRQSQPAPQGVRGSLSWHRRGPTPSLPARGSPGQSQPVPRKVRGSLSRAVPGSLSRHPRDPGCTMSVNSASLRWTSDRTSGAGREGSGVDSCMIFYSE